MSSYLFKVIFTGILTGRYAGSFSRCWFLILAFAITVSRAYTQAPEVDDRTRVGRKRRLSCETRARYGKRYFRGPQTFCRGVERWRICSIASNLGSAGEVREGNRECRESECGLYRGS